MPALSSKEASSLLLDNIEKFMDPFAGDVFMEPFGRNIFPDATQWRKKYSCRRNGYIYGRSDYLAAARQLLQLRLQQQLQPALASKDIHDRADSLLDKAMAFLAMEFCQIRIWRFDARTRTRRDYHLGISPASVWESISRGCGSGSGSTACWPSPCGSGSSGSSASWPSSSGSFTNTSGESSNDGSLNVLFHSAISLCDDMPFQSGKLSSDTSFIDRKSLSALDEIAGVVIEGGFEFELMLRRAMDRHSAQLASSYVEILDMDKILGGHMEEPKDILLRAWTSGMHIIIGLLSEMQRQLNGLKFCSFNTFKEDYFQAIAKESVMKLFKSASSICLQESPQIDPSTKETYAVVKVHISKMVNVVMMYQALNYVMSKILALFSGQTKKFILVEGERLSHGLSDMFLKQSVELHDLMRSQRLIISDTGVHRATKHIMIQMRLFVQLKNTIIHLLILKGDLRVFDDMVIQLITSLEFMLDMNSKRLQLQGQQEIFLLNNVHFMHQEVKKNTDLELILGEDWLLQHSDLVDRLITYYVDAAWKPIVSSFERRTRIPVILWPHQLFDKFISSFEMTYRAQKSWKVTDPLVRKLVREAVCRKVIPLYQMHVENHSDKKTRYSSEQLESQLLELFEG